jgi:cellulose synthase operon protein YhjQ
MNSRVIEAGGEQPDDGTPDDVAALYRWAKVRGTKYRDFSASRREYRAQVRYRAAVALRDRELLSHAAAEEAAAEAERSATSGEATAVRLEVARLEVVLRAEAVARAQEAVRREEREILEAQDSSQRQAARYAEPKTWGSEIEAAQASGDDPYLSEADVDESERAVSNQELEAGDGGLVDAIEETQPVFALSLLRDSVPMWLASGYRPEEPSEAAPHSARTPVALANSQPHGGETLLDSRERVAARWFALKGVFDESAAELPAMHPVRTGEARMAVVAVFSLAGGVGKTSLVATLGRALSTQGERVVLADTTSHGLLPFYFGVRELRAGVVRTFSPPEGSTDEAVSLVRYELEGKSEDAQQEALTEEILGNRVGHHRVLLDLASGVGASWLVQRMAGLQPTVLVPMAPDMNSVISLQAVERVFQGIVDSDGRQLLPFYVLNQFDAALPLHLDVREVLRRQLGDRLVRIAIRRSPAVSEALADGITLVDYAPDAPVTQDYLDVASWLRSVSPAATLGTGVRAWSER